MQAYAQACAHTRARTPDLFYVRKVRKVRKNKAPQGLQGSQPLPNLGEVRNMRAKMPRCAAFVDALREAFGVEEINNVIKRGLRPEAKPEHRVHFAEAGHELGRPAGVLGVEVSPALLVVLSAPVANRGRR